MKKYPAVAALLPVIAGIIFSDVLFIPAYLWISMAVALTLSAVWWQAKHQTSAVQILLLLILLCISGFSYTLQMKTFPPSHISQYSDGETRYTIFATIDDWPNVRNQSTIVYAAVDSLLKHKRTVKVKGRILINISTENTSLQYGDRVTFDARLYPVRGGPDPGGFDYRRFLNLRSVYASAYLPHQFGIKVDKIGKAHFYGIVDRLRNQIISTFKSTLESSPATLASGFLIGETRDIDPEIYELFRDTGTLHLLAVSGSNVGLIVLVFLFLLKASPLKRPGRTIFLLIIIIIFSFLSYNQPSVIRAAIMASLVLVGKAFQRKVEYNNIIAVTAMIILLVNPTQLFDIGFQLSFATAWGLIFIAPRISLVLINMKRSRITRYAIFSLIVSVIAQMVSLPLSAYYFNRLPLISFVSNLVIIPMVSITVIGEVVLLFGALVHPLIGMFLGSLLNPLLVTILWLLQVFDSAEMSFGAGFNISIPWLLFYYSMIVMLVLSIKSVLFRKLAVFTALIGTILFVGSGLLHDNDQRKITALSTSSGYIAISDHEPAQIILSDLPEKPYSYTDKIIKPFLESSQLSSFGVIVISGNYQTLTEAIMLAQLSGRPEIYLPQKYENLAWDIFKEHSIQPDGISLFYIEDNNNAHALPDSGVFIKDGLLVYTYENGRIIFADGRTEHVDSIITKCEDLKKQYLIISQISLSETEMLENHEFRQNLYLISNRIDRLARAEIEEISKKISISSNILIPSQVGAVEIVIKDGHILPR